MYLYGGVINIKVMDEAALMEAGFVKRVVDIDAIIESYQSGQYLDLIHTTCNIEQQTADHPKRLKINKRRAVNHLDSLSIGEEKAS